MAADAFTVDPDALRAVGSQLTALAERLAEARRVTQGIDGSAFGHQKLTAAAHDFVSHWSWQAERLATTLSDTASRLGQAAAQYAEVEQGQLRMQGQAG